ncbi:hypothetical protein [Paraflavitalea speifideaquila]|uniref:hypothetical protein n=1 Tax=Paraflavitalea speifideaquila TaxID=3076558 RepID=UPI0028E9F52A|nr:hypothetical protein [Paraflavitalea speifideiaquila]
MKLQSPLPALEQKLMPNRILTSTTYFRQILDAKEQTNLKPTVKAAVGARQPGQLLTRHSAELGMLFIIPEANLGEPQWYYMDKITYKSDRYNRIEELLGYEQWDNPENYVLLEYWFGTEKAPCVNHA